MPPSNPTPPPGGSSQKLSLDHESLQALRDLITAVKGSSQVTQRTSRSTAKAVEQQVVEAKQSRQSPARLKPPPKTFDQEVGEGIAAHQKRIALRSAIGAVVNPPPKPPKTFDQQVGEGIASRQKRQSLNEAVNAHFKETPKTFDQEVGEGIASRQKRQSLSEAVNAHFKAPPKTFDQQVSHTVAARQQSKALNDAVEAQINPPKSFKERVQAAVETQKSNKVFSDAVSKAANPMQFAASRIASRAAAPLAAAAFAVDTASTLQRNIDNPYMSKAEANRSFWKSMPMGETVTGWVDSATGREQKVREDKKWTMDDTERGRLQLDRIGLNASISPLQAGISAMAQTRRGQQPALPPIMDRSSASGEQAYQIAMKLLPLKQDTLRTEIALRKATAETAAASGTVNAIAAKRKDIDANIEKHREGYRTETSSQKQETHKNQIEMYEKQSDALRPMEEAAHRNVFEKQSEQIAARGEHYKAIKREDLIGQAEALQDQATRGKSTATSLGMMDVGDREKAVWAAKTAQKHGLDSLPADEKALVQRILPADFEAMAAKLGAGTRGYSDLQQAGFVGAPGAPGTSPSDLQLQADKKKNEAAKAEHDIDVGMDAATERAATKLAGALTKVLDTLVAKVEAKVEDAMRRAK